MTEVDGNGMEWNTNAGNTEAYIHTYIFAVIYEPRGLLYIPCERVIGCSGRLSPERAERGASLIILIDEFPAVGERCGLGPGYDFGRFV